MKKQLNHYNLLYIIIGLLIVCCIVLGFIAFKGNGTISDKYTSFEDKEKCMKYYDSFKKTLEERRNTDEEDKIKYGFSDHVSQYEMFYSPKIDSCVVAYSRMGFTYDLDNNYKAYPDDTYTIVDFLNGEKELFFCTYNAYLSPNEPDPMHCRNKWEKEKEGYKIQN